MVNRHENKSITANIVNNAGGFSGKAEASIVNVDDPKATFEFDKQEQYKPVTKSVQIINNKLSYSFPPHSFTQIKVGVEGK